VLRKWRIWKLTPVALDLPSAQGPAFRGILELLPGTAGEPHDHKLGPSFTACTWPICFSFLCLAHS
jgi:hypothetical protein